MQFCQRPIVLPSASPSNLHAHLFQTCAVVVSCHIDAVCSALPSQILAKAHSTLRMPTRSTMPSRSRMTGEFSDRNGKLIVASAIDVPLWLGLEAVHDRHRSQPRFIRSNQIISRRV